MAARIVVALAASCAAAGDSRIDDYVRAEMALNGIPGAAVAVVHDGGIVYARGFGVRSTVSGEPMTADTPVDLASVSKSFTALAVLELGRQGRLRLDAPVVEYIPELGGGFAGVKLRHLMRHTSGLTRRDDSRMPCCGASGELDLRAAAARLAKAAPAPGAPFTYANSNYVLLAAVVARVSGQPFPAYMREAVFQPLGMAHTTLDPAEARAWGLAEPHERRWSAARPSRASFMGWYGSSLVKSTARDMAVYLARVLEKREAMSEPYDLGWFIRRRPEWPGKPQVLEHGGETWGGNTAVIVVPAWNRGAVVLLNIGVHRAADMARGVAALSAGLPAPRPAKTAWTRDTDTWAIAFTLSAGVLLAGATAYAMRAWAAVRRGKRRFVWRRWPAIRAAVLVLMTAELIRQVIFELGLFPESLRTSLRLLAASGAVVLVLTAATGLLVRAVPNR